MKILVTGASGFVGSSLVPALLERGDEVVAVDTFWFGNFTPKSDRVSVYQADIRDLPEEALNDVEAVVHLANIANDPAVELAPTLSWEVNVLGTQQLLDAARRQGVGHFIFASSGSVYGVKAEPNVTEDLPLVPISAYNKTKMVAERVCLSYSDSMKIHNLRPATVCGMSARMRFDVSVNLFVLQAFSKGHLTIFGGNQVRPNVHISDMVRAYLHFLDNPDLPFGNYNVGFENLTIRQIAEMVAERTGATLSIEPSHDPRSYRQNSDKLLQTGFTPSAGVSDAIDQVWQALESGTVLDDPRWHTVKWMKEHLSEVLGDHDSQPA